MKLKALFRLFIFLIAASLALFFTNPDQGTHCSSIKNEYKKDHSFGPVVGALICQFSTYDDYYLFSVTNYKGEIVSYGAFGKVFVNTDVPLIGERP